MESTRRTFLGAPLALGAAAAARSPKSANDRIHLGLIGAGGRAGDLIQELARAKAENFDVVALCDVYRVNREAAAARLEKEFGVRPRETTRYQELLSWPEVDAVLIAAPDFTHSEILQRAVEAGKDVYCEKPMGVELHEARRAYFAVKQSGRIVQIGTQRRSDSNLIAAARHVRSGVLGKITRIEAEYNFYEPRWRRDFSEIRQENIDWPAYLFDRSDRPFDARRFRQWQLFSDYTNGIPGLWMSHLVDLVHWFMDERYPLTAVASGGVYLWKDGRETSDVFRAVLEYPKGFQFTFAMSLTNSGGNRNLWFGTRGTLDADALRITGDGSKDPDRIQQEIRIEGEPVESHMVNWLRCLRSRETPRADIQAGFSHTVAGSITAEALRTGRRVRFDSQALESVS